MLDIDQNRKVNTYRNIARFWQPEKTKLDVIALLSKRLTHMVTGIPTQYTATVNTSAAQYFYKCLSEN